MERHGCKVIAVSDHAACYYQRTGLPITLMADYVTRTGSLAGFSKELLFDPQQLLTHPCTVLVPAAVERVIDGEIAQQLQCRVLAEAANGPTTPDADLVLQQRKDVFVIPDILCNAGGVIVSYFEWVQDLQQLFWDREEVMSRLRAVLDGAYDRVMARSTRDRLYHRTAAMTLGIERVRDAKHTRGLFP
ncbi:MAG: hypothetical protein QM808_11650 [Steroidobacteraceae bacterium]